MFVMFFVCCFIAFLKQVPINFFVVEENMTTFIVVQFQKGLVDHKTLSDFQQWGREDND